MQRNIIIFLDKVSLQAELSDSLTADAIWDALPISSDVNIWGEELYFTVPVQAEIEPGALEIVENGDLGYWPAGAAFCIFFGPTPVSRHGEIRPASAVNVFGKIKGNPEVLKHIPEGSKIEIKRVI